MTKGAIVLCLLSAPLIAQETSISGTAVDAATGRPLPGVRLRVFALGPQSVTAAYGATSDREGNFSIANVRPGSYLYMGELTGYLTVRKGGGGSIPLPSLLVKAGMPVTGFRLEMTPRANVSGRVLDEYGDPVEGARVQLTPVSADAPVAFSLTANAGPSDDRGEFRIAAGPGKYHIQATAFGGSRASETRTDGTSPSVYAPTYYPSSATLDRAQVVEVASGGEVRGIEIRMARPHSPAAIEGRVTGPPEEVSRAQIYVLALDSNGGSSSMSIAPGADGSFSYRNLRPATYRMVARSQGSRPMQSQAVEFTVPPAPGGVELRLAAGAELSARVALDQGELPAAKRTVRLQPTGAGSWMSPSAAGETGDDGSARILDVFPGVYRVTARPLPENAYVRSVELDGAVAPSDHVDLSRGGSRLKITIARNGAQISGSVLDKDGARGMNSYAAVALLRDRTQIESLDEDHYCRADADGSYRFEAIAPGKYWLLAVDLVRSGEIGNAETRKKYAELAEEVEVKEGARVRKDLRVVTKEAVDAKSKR